MSDLMKVGSDFGGSGTFKPLTSSISGAQRTSDAHGRFSVPALEGRLFSGGMGLTAIANVTYTTGTLGATCTPVVGVWNPATSNKNLILLQAVLGVTMTAVQATGTAPFAWAYSIGNAALTLGAQPLSRVTLNKSGSVARDMTNAALTGLTNNLVVAGASSMGGGSNLAAAFLATQAGMQTPQMSYVENLDGSIVVPPGGVVVLLATTTAVAHSAVSMLLWEEVPILNVT